MSGDQLALEQALADLVDAARAIGVWKAEPAPLTLAERAAWNARIAELTAAEANARIAIRGLFAQTVEARAIETSDLRSQYGARQ